MEDNEYVLFVADQCPAGHRAPQRGHPKTELRQLLKTNGFRFHCATCGAWFEPMEAERLYLEKMVAPKGK